MPLLASTAGPGLHWLDHVVIAGYLLAMLSMGLYIARKQHSTEDFFVGGRNLPAWAVGISLLASLFSTITYLGMPGEMFRSGVSFLTRQLGIPLVLLVVWYVWLPFFTRLNLTSAYEYLERRFDYATRALAAAFCMLLLLGWMSVVVLTASKAMAEIAHLDLEWFLGANTEAARMADVQFIIVSVGLFSVVYTTLGGIRAVVWTDVAQFAILFGGALFTMGYVGWSTGSGPADWIAAQQAYPHRETVEWFSTDVGNRSTIFTIAIGMFFWHACTHGANQVALQRYFSVKSMWSARWSFFTSAFANFFLGCTLAVVGLSLIYFLDRDDNPDTLPVERDVTVAINGDDDSAELAFALRRKGQDAVFPQFIGTYLPPGTCGLVVAALFAAAMSTIDSGANSISTIVTIDFVRPFSDGKRTPEVELRIARVLTASMGLVIVVATLLLYRASEAQGTDIITLCQKGFNCFLGPLGGLFVLAMFSPWSTPGSVIPALLFGEAVGVAASYSEELFETAYSTHLVVPTAWAATVAAGLAFGLLFGTRVDDERRRWMWREVVTRE